MNAKLVMLIVPLSMACAPLGKAPEPQKNYRGTEICSPIPAVAACELLLERETIKFNIDELPDPTKEQSVSATAEVEYSLYNPTQEEVSLGFYLPCGVRAGYMKAKDFDALDYFIETDGAPQEAAVRHSYVGYFNASPDLEAGVAKIQGGYQAFYSEQMPVTEYSFHVDMPAQAEDGGFSHAFAVDLVCNPRMTRLVSDSRMGTNIVNGDLRVLFDADADKTDFTLYAIGQKPASMRCTCYSDCLCREELDGSVAYSERETTFYDFAMRSYPEGARVSKRDWFAGFSEMLDAGTVGNTGAVYVKPSLKEDEFMRWYEYTVRVPAGGRVTHTVRAPLLPALDGTDYAYTFCLTPARRFSAVEQFSVSVETPYILTNSSLDFTKDAAGGVNTYTFEKDTLPCGELTFTVRKTEAGAAEVGNVGMSPSVKLAIVILCVVAGGGGAAVVAWLIVSRKKKK